MTWEELAAGSRREAEGLPGSLDITYTQFLEIAAEIGKGRLFETVSDIYCAGVAAGRKWERGEK